MVSLTDSLAGMSARLKACNTFTNPPLKFYFVYDIYYASRGWVNASG
jgi:hypothetical protein